MFGSYPLPEESKAMWIYCELSLEGDLSVLSSFRREKKSRMWLRVSLLRNKADRWSKASQPLCGTIYPLFLARLRDSSCVQSKLNLKIWKLFRDLFLTWLLIQWRCLGKSLALCEFNFLSSFYELGSRRGFPKISSNFITWHIWVISNSHLSGVIWGQTEDEYRKEHKGQSMCVELGVRRTGATKAGGLCNTWTNTCPELSIVPRKRWDRHSFAE